MNADMLRRLGFEGFVSTSTLRSSRCAIVPTLPGVYAVVREALDGPEFLPVSPAGPFKGKDPTIAPEYLHAKWVTGSNILYFGKAGAAGTAATLRRRVSTYLRHGSGKPAGHWGGRAIWQLEDAGDLQIAWYACAEEPRTLERRLLAEFEARHGTLPFANLTR